MEDAAVKARRAVIDELGALEAELKPLAGKIARVDQIKRLLRGFAEDQPAEQGITLHGERFAAVLTAKTEEASLDLDRIYSRVGHKAFLASVSMTLGALEKLIPIEQERAPFVVRKRTGSRRVSTVSLAA
jgi:hypothetical protein